VEFSAQGPKRTRLLIFFDVLKSTMGRTKSRTSKIHPLGGGAVREYKRDHGGNAKRHELKKKLNQGRRKRDIKESRQLKKRVKKIGGQRKNKRERERSKKPGLWGKRPGG